MSYDFVHIAFYICVFIWFPLMTIVLVFLMARILKKTKPKLDKMTSFSVNGIAMMMFVKSIPALLIYIILLLPVFYFNHQTKQYDYCMQVVQVNRMTDPSNRMLQERCAQFDLYELIEKSYAGE